jgi:hypothetical protein|tara:strand:- start:49 stop:450 length:402 start_codon:yes stop_codon:yes gene_type:complete
MKFVIGILFPGPKSRSVYWALVLALLTGLGPMVARAQDDRPIIAHLYDDPKGYSGRSLTIYGLVIEATKIGNEFILQDVSQMPLRIVRKDFIFPAVVGDQMLLQGVFFANNGDPYFEARKITYTKVVGGGGCC